jgi:hypothetical protein
MYGVADNKDAKLYDLMAKYLWAHDGCDWNTITTH